MRDLIFAGGWNTRKFSENFHTDPLEIRISVTYKVPSFSCKEKSIILVYYNNSTNPLKIIRLTCYQNARGYLSTWMLWWAMLANPPGGVEFQKAEKFHWDGLKLPPINKEVKHGASLAMTAKLIRLFQRAREPFGHEELHYNKGYMKYLPS